MKKIVMTYAFKTIDLKDVHLGQIIAYKTESNFYMLLTRTRCTTDMWGFVALNRADAFGPTYQHANWQECVRKVISDGKSIYAFDNLYELCSAIQNNNF